MTSLFDQVRLLNNRLIEIAEELQTDGKLTAPARAVLEYLHRQGPSTVPDVARARNVTRQHIQTITNELLNRDLVERRANPAHRRSQLLALTESGRQKIEETLAREGEYMGHRLNRLDEDELRRAAETLSDVRRAFADDPGDSGPASG